jgi:preprotein translocase subunit SecA
VRRFFDSLFAGPAKSAVSAIKKRRDELAGLPDRELKTIAAEAKEIDEVMAVTAVVASRLLGLDLFDVQVQGALALAAARIAEMQTGEGKTLTAVPAVIWFARNTSRNEPGVHVMTVNDYLARRDAKWMGGIYEFFGLSVGVIQQGMSAAERRHAYACDITYATANEIGFDFLRDQMALYPADQVHRPFSVAVIDEADSILIDEARIPLVIAGGDPDSESLACKAARITRTLHPHHHYRIEEYGRNVTLTDTGIHAVETALGCGNLFDPENFEKHTAVQDSLHARALLHRDVDYVVKNGAVESVDEFKGRIAQDRRWPAGLHAAIEAKEGLAPQAQGRVLGSITLQNLIALYPRVCGMTGTAATQAEELRALYNLDVAVIPTNRPMIRVDHPDSLFRTKAEKEQALVREIAAAHASGRPVLVGTASVEESERLSSLLGDTPHAVLNARNEEQEAAIIANAGQRSAVTISTNMAGRGTDIKLGEGVAALGGLYVIGTNRHESRRIDNQLRGRAGRQGDPGSSRFFVSLEDPLLVKYAAENAKVAHDPESIQRLVEGQNLDARKFLHKYEGVIEGQRQRIARQRQAILTGEVECGSETERLVALTTIDDLWAEHLAEVTELREGIQWTAWGGRDPLHEYLTGVDVLFQNLEAAIPGEIARRLEEALTNGIDPAQRGATWTYLTTDNPFGSWSERIMRGLKRKFAGRGR